MISAITELPQDNFIFFLISLFKLQHLCSNFMGLLTNPFPLCTVMAAIPFSLVLHIPQTIFRGPSLLPLQLPSIFRRAVTGTAHALPGADTLDSRHTAAWVFDGRCQASALEPWDLQSRIWILGSCSVWVLGQVTESVEPRCPCLQKGHIPAWRRGKEHGRLGLNPSSASPVPLGELLNVSEPRVFFHVWDEDINTCYVG